MKRRATSSENRKFFVVVVKSALGIVIVKKMLTNGGFVKLLRAYVGLSRAGKALAVVRGRRLAMYLRTCCLIHSFNIFSLKFIYLTYCIHLYLKVA